MNDSNRKAHWETVYTTKGENEVSWFQENPAPSLELIGVANPTPQSAIVDIGGGASHLVDSLVARGFGHVTVLDISQAALDVAKARLGARAGQVQWVVADVTQWRPTRTFDVWHDRGGLPFSGRSGGPRCLPRASEAGGPARRSRHYRDVCDRWPGKMQRATGRPI